MKTLPTSRIAAGAFLALAAISCGSLNARADDAGTAVYMQDWDPANPDVVQPLRMLSNDVSGLGAQVDAGWQEKLPTTCARVKAGVEKPYKLAGKRLAAYDTECTLAQSGDLIVKPSSIENGKAILNFSYTLKNSFVKFTIQLPAVGPLLDPRVSVTFDATTDYTISAALSGPVGPQPAAPLALVKATTKVSNVVIDSEGPVADTALAMASAILPPPIIEAMLGASLSRDLPLNELQSQIDKLNASIGQQLGTARLTGAFGEPSMNRVVLVVAAPWAPNSSGEIAADVIWKHAGTTAPDNCAVFGFTASYQIGPAPLTGWSPSYDYVNGPIPQTSATAPSITVQPTSFVPDGQWDFAGNDACKAVFESMPVGVPVTVTGLPPQAGSINSQIGGVQAKLTPNRQIVKANPVARADFSLSTTIVGGTGVSQVQTTPQPDGGDPAGNVGINFSGLFGAVQRQQMINAAINDQRNVQTAPPAPNLGKLNVGTSTNWQGPIAPPPAPTLGNRILQNANNVQTEVTAPPAPNLGTVGSVSKSRFHNALLYHPAVSDQEASANQQVIR